MNAVTTPYPLATLHLSVEGQEGTLPKKSVVPSNLKTEELRRAARGSAWRIWRPASGERIGFFKKRSTGQKTNRSPSPASPSSSPSSAGHFGYTRLYREMHTVSRCCTTPSKTHFIMPCVPTASRIRPRWPYLVHSSSGLNHLMSPWL